MERFDFKSSKYIIFVIAICLVFVFIVANAYNYLPEKAESDSTQKDTQITEYISSQEENVQNNSDPDEISTDSEDIDEEDSENSFTNRVEVQKKQEEFTPTLEPINEEVQQTGEDEQQKDNDKFSNYIKKADTCIKNSDYKSALELINQSNEFVTNNEEKATYYEYLALVNACMKKYGTALSLAQKSYNLVPTTSREVLVARIYYKIGEVEKANLRMNNVLKREFSVDK